VHNNLKPATGIGAKCGVKCDRIDNIAYIFRCLKLDMQQHQDFLLQGIAWKNIDTHQLNKLLLSDLKKELSMRGVYVSYREEICP